MTMMGTLNIWVRNDVCEVVEQKAHLHVYNCHKRQVFGAELSGGHAELRVPPGCYILTAGVRIPGHSNIYTDKTMVVVGCGRDVCVNLVLNNFVEPEEERPQKKALIEMGCGARIIPALVINALRAGVAQEELKTALRVISKAANLDLEQLRCSIEAEVEVVEEGLKEEEGAENVKERLNMLKMSLFRM